MGAAEMLLDLPARHSEGAPRAANWRGWVIGDN
jgi:hypothetical protein